MTLFYFVPRHTLGEEVAQEFETLHPELSAAVYRGIERPDPNQRGYTMCHDLELADAAIGAGQSLESACGVCDASALCGYIKQRDIQADFWVLANHLLFHPKPNWLPEPTALIIDEDFTQAGLAGFDKQHPVRITISTFSAPPGIFPKRSWADDADRADLANYRAKLCLALADCEGALRREALVKAGLTHTDCMHAVKIEWRYKGRLELQPGTSREDALHAFSVVANTFTARVPLVWELAAELLDGDFIESPNLTIQRNRKAPKGEGSADYIQLHWRRKISKSYRDKPALILDATGNPDLIRPYFPNVEEVVNVAAHAPHRRIRQIVDRPCAKSMFVYPRAPSTAANNIKRLRRFIEVDAAEYRGKGKNGIDVLAVCQMDVETALMELGQVAGVDLAHFNAVAGMNKWQGVAKQVLVGRALPPPADVERMTAVLLGRPVATISQAANNWWRFPAPIHMRDGTKRYVLTPRHPDPMVEAMRWQICEGGLMQGEGRPRAVNREANDPLAVDIVTNVPLALLVDETATWNEIMPSPIELMAARGVIGLDWPTVAAVLPDWFKDKKAVEDWFRHRPDVRERLRSLENPENPYIDTLIGVFGTFSLVSYKIGGNRKSRSALMNLSDHPAPEATLADMTGGEVEIVEVKSLETSSVTYLEAPFDEAKPAQRPVGVSSPWLAVDNLKPPCVPSSEVDKPVLEKGSLLPNDASYAEILDWLTGGGVPMEHDLLEATGIWLNLLHDRNEQNPTNELF